MENRTPISRVSFENEDRIAFHTTGYVSSTVTDKEKDELDNFAFVGILLFDNEQQVVIRN